MDAEILTSGRSQPVTRIFPEMSERSTAPPRSSLTVVSILVSPRICASCSSWAFAESGKAITATAVTISRWSFISFLMLCIGRQHCRRPQKLDLFVERMCKLLVEHSAGRIFRQGRPALLDRAIDDLEILLDDRHRGGIELSPPLAHDVLEHVDLSSVHLD